MAAHRNPPLSKRSSTLTDDGFSTVGSVSPLLLHCQQGACLTCCYPFSNERGGWKAGVGFLNYHLLTQPLHTLPAPPAMAWDTHSRCTWRVFQLSVPFLHHTTSFPHDPSPNLPPRGLVFHPASPSVQLSQNPGKVCYLHVVLLAPSAP